MLPTIVRWRWRSTQSSATCPSSITAIRDSCFVALMTISRAMAGDYGASREAQSSHVEVAVKDGGTLLRIGQRNVAVGSHEITRVAAESRLGRTLTPRKYVQRQHS